MGSNTTIYVLRWGGEGDIALHPICKAQEVWGLRNFFSLSGVLEPFVVTLGMSKSCHFWQPAEATSCQKWQLLDKPINGKRKSQLVSVIGNFCTGLTIAIYGQIRLLPVLARIVLTKWKKWIVCDPFITFRLPRPVVVIVSKFGYI